MKSFQMIVRMPNGKRVLFWRKTNGLWQVETYEYFSRIILKNVQPVQIREWTTLVGHNLEQRGFQMSWPERLQETMQPRKNEDFRPWNEQIAESIVRMQSIQLLLTTGGVVTMDQCWYVNFKLAASKRYDDYIRNNRMRMHDCYGRQNNVMVTIFEKDDSVEHCVICHDAEMLESRVREVADANMWTKRMDEFWRGGRISYHNLHEYSRYWASVWHKKEDNPE